MSGVLAPNAKLRAAVTCIGRPEAETPTAQLPNPTSSRPTPKPPIDPDVGSPRSPSRIRWAVLIARLLEDGKNPNDWAVLAVWASDDVFAVALLA